MVHLIFKNTKSKRLPLAKMRSKRIKIELKDIPDGNASMDTNNIASIRASGKKKTSVKKDGENTTDVSKSTKLVRKTKKSSESAEHSPTEKMMKQICEDKGLNYNKLMISKFNDFIKSISEEAMAESRIKIYGYAFIYCYYKVEGRKKDFVDKFSVKILEGGIKAVKEWEKDSKKTIEKKEDGYQRVCNLYSVKTGLLK
ncbi:hypothetical protein ENBRE01_3362 [Enteropsectra breve]|nr:hypothetical protein ENBRE01_3362 [Enteropsectra breve]